MIDGCTAKLLLAAVSKIIKWVSCDWDVCNYKLVTFYWYQFYIFLFLWHFPVFARYQPHLSWSHWAEGSGYSKWLNPATAESSDHIWKRQVSEEELKSMVSIGEQEETGPAESLYCSVRAGTTPVYFQKPLEEKVLLESILSSQKETQLIPVFTKLHTVNILYLIKFPIRF